MATLDKKQALQDLKDAIAMLKRYHNIAGVASTEFVGGRSASYITIGAKVTRIWDTQEGLYRLMRAIESGDDIM